MDKNTYLILITKEKYRHLIIGKEYLLILIFLRIVCVLKSLEILNTTEEVFNERLKPTLVTK